MYHFESIAEGTISQPQSSRATRFASVTRTNQSQFVIDYVGRHNWLAVVERSFFEDSFNTFGLESALPDYLLAVQVIRGDPVETDMAREVLDRAAEAAYALLHARYIFTKDGMQAIRRKFESGVFGECPRFRCDGQHVLPIGLSCDVGKGATKVFCPRCRDVYESECDLDGAAFGPSFPHFFMQFNRHLKFPKKAEQMRYEFCGIPLAPGAETYPQRLIRDRAFANGPQTGGQPNGMELDEGQPGRGSVRT
jgi:casein kinase II subunit beta